jgi:sulfur carrier protein ThiS
LAPEIEELKMSTASTIEKCTEVTLLRPEGAAQTYTLPEGATLADLLREAGAAAPRPSILIGGRPIEEATVLESGMVITLVPEPPQTPAKKDWRRTVGMIADDADFEEWMAACRAIREADRRATLEQMDAEQEGS